MDLTVKKVLTRRETVLQPQDGDRPLDKLCVAVLIDNPLAGQVAQDLSGLIQASKTLGEDIARILAQLGVDASWESYGKGGIVGLDGEQEQINALLTTTFAEPFRAAVGGAKAWIPSVTKRGAAGVSIDIPLAHKDALYVRSHYDAVTFSDHEHPGPGEVLVMVAVANRGRINPRVGGLSASEIEGKDGLR